MNFPPPGWRWRPVCSSACVLGTEIQADQQPPQGQWEQLEERQPSFCSAGAQKWGELLKSLQSRLCCICQLERWSSRGENMRCCCDVSTKNPDSCLLYRAEMSKHYLWLRQRSWPFALLREEETDRHKELLNAAAEFLFVLSTGGEGEEPSRLHYILKNILLCLKTKGFKS